jgi:transcriptional regulator with XRE-family HTH domain
LPRPRKYTTPAEATIGQRLRELRQRLGKTQAEIAETLGIKQSLVSDYERGVVRLHGDLLIGFAKALKVSADEILGLQGNGHKEAVQDRRLLRQLQRIEKLSKREKQALLKNLDLFLKGAGV